jgi:hypothetical protein
VQRGLSYTSLQEMSLIQSHGPDEVNLSLSHSTLPRFSNIIHFNIFLVFTLFEFK